MPQPAIWLYHGPRRMATHLMGPYKLHLDLKKSTSGQ